MDTFPEQPFEGQIFIDAFRVKWIYDMDKKCWVRSGTVPDIPVASELQPGLLSSKFKQILDGLPEKAGGFGIIARPLLSLKNDSPKSLLKDSISKVFKTDSGTTILGKIPADGRSYTVEQYVGKLLRFKTGLLCNKTFLIFTNDESNIYIDGDVSQATVGDEFEILEPSQFNPSGVLMGDVVLVSDSIDITCVDRNGDVLPDNCTVDKIYVDDPDNPPALNFRLNENFLNNLCVTIPGCKGPRGDRGDKGDPGLSGTGDGPVGEQGDSGDDALIPDDFAGIKIVELDDIFDTAVVQLELDAANGILGVVKAKVRTTSDEVPAEKIVSAPIARSIKFTNPNTFDYEIMMPPMGDPVGEADVSLLKYPNKFVPDGTEETTINRILLSEFIDRVIVYYQNKLSEANDQYNQQIKAYINNIDSQARTILADLADELARCEFELPIDFCLGISPAECNPISQGTNFTFPLADCFFSVTGGTPTGANELGNMVVTPYAVPNGGIVDFPVTFPLQGDPRSSISLPSGGYILQWISGTVKVNDSGGDNNLNPYQVGSLIEGEGLIATVVDGNSPPVVYNFPVPSAPYNELDEKSVVNAYDNAPITEQALGIEITGEKGTITVSAPLTGASVSGSIKLRVIRVNLFL